MVVKINIGKDLQEDVRAALTPLGGISAFIKPGEKVFIKPNFNTSDPFPASSDLDFLRAVLSLVSQQKPNKIILGDSPTFFGNSKKYFETINPKILEREFPDLEVVFLNEHEWVKKEVPGGKFLRHASVPKLLEMVDKIIYLPCLKTHSWAQFTGALKLSVGLLKPTERVLMHSGHLQEKIADLNLLFKPGLVIMDGRKCFIDGGPAQGTIREPKVILASTNRVEVDIEAAKIIQSFENNSLAGLDPSQITQIKRARELGLG